MEAVKEEAARIRATRQKKGDATVAHGDYAYVGPWAAKYDQVEYEVVDGEDLASDEEYEEEEVVESGAVVPALPQALAKRKGGI